MSRQSKRLISLLLLMLLALNAAACKEAPEDKGAADQTQSSQTTAEETEAPEVPGPAKTDLEGYSLRIITTSWINCDKMISAESINGEIINDTMFDAQSRVMNDYNCSYDVLVFGHPNDMGVDFIDRSYLIWVSF